MKIVYSFTLVVKNDYLKAMVACSFVSESVNSSIP